MAGPPTDPADVVNRALDYLGVEAIGDMNEGTTQARAAIRHYSPSVRDLLRAAPWNFARKTRSLDLLWSTDPNDAPYFGTVPTPWRYEYAYPPDCVRVRFLEVSPPQGNGVAGGTAGGEFLSLTGDVIGSGALTSPPPMTGMTIDPFAIRQHPAPYVVAYADDPVGGTQSVILANVKNAQLVYTAAVFNPQIWDSLFMAAVVALIAGRIALAVVPDKKLALSLRQAATAETAASLNMARVADGNEGVTSMDHVPDFIRIRGINGWPIYGYGTLTTSAWDLLSMPDGSSY